MRIHGTFADATVLAMAGSASPPDTSLTTDAPASTAAAATAARVVSMLTGTPSATSSRMTGSTRAFSTSASTRPAPGRVDSPPTSTRSAPASRMPMPWATAWSRSSQRPPSENESGVTLRTPITTAPPRAREPGSHVPHPLLISDNASAREVDEVWNIPRTAEVVVREPGLRTPRIPMQRCSASITTMTPRGSSLRTTASAT